MVCSLNLPNETSRSMELVAKNAAGGTLATGTSLSPETKLTVPLKDLPVGENKIKIKGEPFLMRYDPPWTLPFMRRNELGIEIIFK